MITVSPTAATTVAVTAARVSLDAGQPVITHVAAPRRPDTPWVVTLVMGDGTIVLGVDDVPLVGTGASYDDAFDVLGALCAQLLVAADL